MQEDFINNLSEEYLMLSSCVTQYIPKIDTFISGTSMLEISAKAVKIARAVTKRSKILIIEDPRSQLTLDNNIKHEHILGGCRATLCHSIAVSVERIAAIIIKPVARNLLSYYHYYKKVRELASAEGAIMIWDDVSDILGSPNEYFRLSTICQPDMLCFHIGKEGPQHTYLGIEKTILTSRAIK